MGQCSQNVATHGMDLAMPWLSQPWRRGEILMWASAGEERSGSLQISRLPWPCVAKMRAFILPVPPSMWIRFNHEFLHKVLLSYATDSLMRTRLGGLSQGMAFRIPVLA